MHDLVGTHNIEFVRHNTRKQKSKCWHFLNAVLLEMNHANRSKWKKALKVHVFLPARKMMLSLHKTPFCWSIHETSLYCGSLYCTSQGWIFNKLKVCVSPALRKSIGTFFPKALAHFLCHILVNLTIFHFFIMMVSIFRNKVFLN